MMSRRSPPLRPLSRRHVLFAGAAMSVVAASQRALGAVPDGSGKKLIVVILRGAMDGLAVLPKMDDAHIHAHRGALIDPDAIPLAEGFSLHSAMPVLGRMFSEGDAAFAPAVAGPYRERSHFAAQDLLECGGVSRVVEEGWLNRALQRAPAAFSAVSIGPMQPLILRGAATSTTSWSPPVLPSASDDTINRLLDLYEHDPQLKASLASGLGADMIAGAMDDGPGMDSRNGRGPAAQHVALMSAAGRFIAQPGGPQIAVVSLDGWDTHAEQNAALAQRLRGLDDGLAAMRRELGGAWGDTALIAVSEFGRTVRMNGAQGTDHGTGGLAILAGGAVKGGRMLGGWRGLAPEALFENRDIDSTVDARSLFKGLMHDHLGWDRAGLDGDVFPDSTAAPVLSGLV